MYTSVFVAALFIKTKKEPKNTWIGKWIKKWYIYSKILVLIRKEILKHGTRWMNLEDVVLSEINQF
jgi:hypothetical protein